MAFPNPDNTADDSFYDGFRNLAKLPTSVTNPQIDNDPLFQEAKAEILALLPNADMDDTNESEIRRALQFRGVSYFLEGESDTASQRDASSTVITGDVESETISIGRANHTRKFTPGTTTTSNSHQIGQRSTSDIAEFYLEKSNEILNRLVSGVVSTDTIDADTVSRFTAF